MESGGWKGYYAWLELGEGCFMKIRDYINLDRVLIREQKTLKEIYIAQKKFKELTGKHVYTSMLSGEGCLGFAPCLKNIISIP